MRIRNQGHAKLNDHLRADWMKAIELSPDAFDALLFVPGDSDEITEPDGYEPSLFDEIDNNQKTLSYLDPIPVTVVDCPDENDVFLMMQDGETQLGEGELPLTVRIAHPGIPEGSVLEWEDEVGANKTQRVWWYVHRATGIGTANIGTLYICIPARDPAGLPEHIRDGN
ncbi:hypothetical protein L4174_023875 (plasmid) [Photobacterium sp. CCB-ST2H9]|uniref:hypothetical protein n=1 Tax=Photobacterium sp. CCB-ST2H9 TaxID=2912855 RepID=UPI002005B86B|nr:hypothetical protein [Photobacterium sp. CCB-ST2H9]UTM60426.1 hypothetical protein L4174_023875 [Photobacterium sp. CCB-ST2H9]